MDRAPSKYYVFLIYLLLITVTYVAFEQVRQNKFVYDDELYIVNNPQVKVGLTWKSVKWAFTPAKLGYWYPLTWLSHMLACELFGLNPKWHHVMNLSLHIANTLILFWVLNRMTSQIWLSAFVAATFALHPLHVESVAWVTERKDTLSGFFWMLSIAAYIRYVERPGIRRYLLVFFTLALGLMAKPMLVTLPFVLLLLDYWPFGRFQLGQMSDESNGDSEQSNESVASGYQGSVVSRLILEKVPFFMLSAISVYLSSLSVRRLGISISMESVPIRLRIANALVSYLSYIGKMIWPRKLAVFYPYPHTVPLWEVIGALLTLISVSVLAIWMFRSRRFLAVGWLWYLGTLIPVSGLVQAGLWPAMADRFTYLPSIGIFIAITWAATKIFAHWRYQRITLAIAASAALTAMLLCTRAQVKNWQDNLTLYGHAIKATRNNFMMHYNYGCILLKEKQFDSAIKHFNKTLQINPEFEDAQLNIGLAFQKQGKYQQAVENFNKALQLDPNNPKPYYNIGIIYFNQGKLDQAAAQYNKALRLNPNFPEAHNNLGNVFREQGKLDEAIKHYKQALSLRPNWQLAEQNLSIAESKKQSILHNNLGTAFCLEKNYDKAMYHWNLALKFKADFPDALNNIAWLMASQENSKFRNPTKALEYARRACELTEYNRPNLLDTLAVAYSAAARFSEAIETAEKAINLAENAGREDLAEEIRKRLRLYQAGRPYFEN